MESNNAIIAFGTLREDISIKYDFSNPIKIPEKRVDEYQKLIGGSVYNTCRFLADMDDTMDVIFCTHNYSGLINTIRCSGISRRLHIVIPDESPKIHPLTLIGVKDNGDKTMISCDVPVDFKSVFEKIICYTKKSKIMYTSFYEVTEDNYLDILNLFERFLSRNDTSIVIDLCPLITQLKPNIIDEVLKKIKILTGNAYEHKTLLKILGLREIRNLFDRFTLLETVFIKKGEDGAEVISRNCEKLNYKENNDYVINNTTGCGDIFNAVVLQGIVKEKENRMILEEAVKKGGKIARGGLPWKNN